MKPLHYLLVTCENWNLFEHPKSLNKIEYKLDTHSSLRPSNQAEKISRELREMRGGENLDRLGNYKASLYDIQQCGRDNIEVLLWSIDPQLALVVRS